MGRPGLASDREAVPAGGEGLDRDGGRLRFRLAGDRVGLGRDEGVDPAARREAVGPMDRHEDRARALAVGDEGADDHVGAVVLDAHEARRANGEALGVGGGDLDEGFGDVAGETRRDAGAGHRVPLVANAAGVEPERPFGRRPGARRAEGRGDEAAPAVGGEEATVGEEALLGIGRRLAGPARPLERGERVEAGVVEAGEGGDVEIPSHVRAMAGEARVFPEDAGGGLPAEGLAPAEPPADLGERPPVGLGLADRGHETALAADAALGIGDGAVLLAPGFRRQQDVGEFGGVGGAHHLGDHHEGTVLDGALHAIGVGQAVDRVGRHDPQRLDAPVGDGVEEVDRLVAGGRGDPRRAPELLDEGAMGGVGEFEMGGELVGEAADLASAHGVGLAGHRERPGALLADAAGEEVAIDDGIDLVGAGRGLIDALAVDRHHLLGRGEESEEGLDVARREAGDAGDLGRIGEGGGGREGLVEAGGVIGDEGGVAPSRALEHVQQAGEERHVRSRREAEMKIGEVVGGGAAGVDVDHLHGGARGLGGGDALVEDRVAPGEVGADQHHQIGLFEILVGAGHGVGAEGALVAGDRGGHAQARIRVDVGRADEALHQLVGDVIVLGQDLTRHVERHTVGAVIADRGGEGVGDPVERLVPGGEHAADLRMRQAAVGNQRLGERRPLHAEPAVIGGMIGIAGDRHRAVGVDVRLHAAAGAAIGAGGEGRADDVGHAGLLAPTRGARVGRRT